MPTTFNVNSTLDSGAVDLTTGKDFFGNITLRSALMAANSPSHPSYDYIILPAGTFTLVRAGRDEDAASLGDLDIVGGQVIINGAGAGATIVDAGGLDRAFHVLAGATLDLQGLTIRGGNANSGGGAIANLNRLTVIDCTISGNRATDIEGGGGVLNRGYATIRGCTLSENSADYTNFDGEGGGGIVNHGTLVLTASNLTDNRSGKHAAGIANDQSTLTVLNCQFTGNLASNGYAGGAISSSTTTSGSLTVANSTFSENSGSGGGAIFNHGPATISGCTFTGNAATDHWGGAIAHGFDTMTVSNCTFSGNWSRDGTFNSGAGGAIHNTRTMVVTNCIFSGNVAHLSGYGGAIGNSGGDLTISGSLFSANNSEFGVGGAIANIHGTVTASDSTFTGNSAQRYGGAVFNSGLGVMTLSNSTLAGNSACSGGGISNGDSRQRSDSSLRISGCTLTGNIATGVGSGFFGDAGGGILNGDGCALTVTSTTLSGNSAAGPGGGIHNKAGGTVTVTSSTLTGNATGPSAEGGGLFNEAGGALTMRNTIVAGNLSGANGDVRGTVSAPSHNLLGNAAGSSGFSVANGDLLNVNPLLGPLADNGGATLTHALLVGSPAIDAGENAPPMTDQRGRPRITDGPDANTTATIDIGAFEANPSIEDITDKVTGEDVPLSFKFNLGDAALGVAVQLASSNTLLVPNAATHLSVTGAGGTRSLNITPAANQSGVTVITVVVTAGGQSMQDTFVLTVNPVNDAPVLDNGGTMRLESVYEDDTTNLGTRVSDLMASAGGDRVTDGDAGAVEGIAVTAVDGTNGSWQYSLDSGATWNKFASVSESAARLLDAGAFVRFVPNAHFTGASSITFRAWDQTAGVNGGTANTTTNGGSSPFSTAAETASVTVLPVNDPPILGAIGSRSVDEGSPLTFTAFATDNDSGVLSYSLDAGAPAGASINPTTGAFTWTPVDGPGFALITVRVTDNGSPAGFDTETILVAVNNVGPLASLTGPSAGVPAQPLVFHGAFVDPGAADTHTVSWTFGDGAAASGALAQSHAYARPGSYVVAMTVRDKDGGATTAQQVVKISRTLLQPDAAGLTDLLVGGRPGNDIIGINPHPAGVEVTRNGVGLGTYAPTGRIIVYGGDGDDQLTAAAGITMNLLLDGGDGDDQLVAMSGKDILVGGEGNDVLNGGAGADLLLGGDGADLLQGLSGADLLIGDATAYDLDAAALRQIVGEWTSARTYADKVSRLSNGTDGLPRLDTSTVFHDLLAVDQLFGGAARDWFFATNGKDLLPDRVGTETVS